MSVPSQLMDRARPLTAPAGWLGMGLLALGAGAGAAAAVDGAAVAPSAVGAALAVGEGVPPRPTCENA